MPISLHKAFEGYRGVSLAVVFVIALVATSAEGQIWTASRER